MKTDSCASAQVDRDREMTTRQANLVLVETGERMLRFANAAERGDVKFGSMSDSYVGCSGTRIDGRWKVHVKVGQTSNGYGVYARGEGPDLITALRRFESQLDEVEASHG